MKRTILVVSLAVFAASAGLAESWPPFSGMAKYSDFIAQYQELVRDGKVIGTRLVRVYWEKEGFKRPKYLNSVKPWALKDYSRSSDTLVTKFVFHGPKQQLWTAVPEKGVVQYPGETAWMEVGREISCSVIEFHEILVEVGKLKRQGKPVKGNLAVTVFGREKKSE